MKSSLLIVLFISLLCKTTAQQGNKFLLTGSVKGQNTGKLFLLYRIHGKKVIDSSVVRNGRFVFAGSIGEPVKAELVDNLAKTQADYKNYYSNFYLEPGKMNISLVNDRFREAQLTGSKTDEVYQVFNNGLHPALDAIGRIQKETDTDSSRSDILMDSLSFYNGKAQSSLGDFIKGHPHSFIRLQAIQQLYALGYISPDSALILFRSGDYKWRNSFSVKQVIQGFENIVNSSIGHLASNFTRTDADKKDFTLSSLKGKWVLLDFWASWCIPCREMTPHIKELYNKYHEKGLEIVTVSCDSKYKDWYKAIQQDSIEPFVNVLSFTESDMEFLKTHDRVGEASWKGELRKLFNLMPIPVTVLLDKNGVIIGRYGAQDEQPSHMLDKDLEKIFNNLQARGNKQQ